MGHQTRCHIARWSGQPAAPWVPGGPTSTVGTYSNNWSPPSKVRLSTRSSLWSGYPSYSNEIVLRLGAEPKGLTSAEVRRIIADIDQTVDVVGLTIAEFIPRQVMHLQQILKDFILIGGSQIGSETSQQMVH